MLSCWTIEWPLEGGLCYETNTVRIRGLLEWWLDCLAILLPPWQHCGTSYRLLRLHDKTWRNDLELKNWGFIKIYLFLKQYSYRILQIPRCWHQVLDYFIMYLLQYVKRLISVLLQRVTFSHSIPGFVASRIATLPFQLHLHFNRFTHYVHCTSHHAIIILWQQWYNNCTWQHWCNHCTMNGLFSNWFNSMTHFHVTSNALWLRDQDHQSCQCGNYWAQI